MILNYDFTDLMEEISSELNIAEEEKSPTFFSKPEKIEEDLWAPKKLTPCLFVNPDDTYVAPKYPVLKASETLNVTVPRIVVIFELEQTARVPVLIFKVSLGRNLLASNAMFIGRAGNHYIDKMEALKLKKNKKLKILKLLFRTYLAY